MTAPLDALTALYPQITTLNTKYQRNETYYAGEIRPEAISLALPPEVQRLRTVVNWSAVVVNAIEERLKIQGFRLGDNATANDQLWSIWEYNELDHYSSLAHIEALVQGRAWLTVDVNEADPEHPTIMAEAADALAVDMDPKTRTIQAAVRRWCELDSNNRQINLATVYLPDSTSYFIQDSSGWKQYDQNIHNTGEVLVFPLVNESRLPSARNPQARWGVSELESTIPLVDAACRSLTNLQVAQEFLAVPSRYVLGVPADEFRDADGQQVSAWEAYMGRFNALEDPDGTAKVLQLPGADLTNFSGVLNTYAKLLSSVSAVPLRMFGVSSDANPASAEAIAADEGRLVMRALRKQRSFGNTYEKVMTAAAKLAGIDIPDSERLECWWSDPATPTFATKATALAALFSAGVPLPKSYMYDVLDFTPEQRAQAESEVSADPIVQLLKGGYRANSATASASDGPADGQAGSINAAGNGEVPQGTAAGSTS